MASTTIELVAGDGHRLEAHLAHPAGTPRGALVVVQEIFGVNAHIRAVADGFAAEGYLAIAPALFDRVERRVELGYAPEHIQLGVGLRTRVGTDAPLLDLAAAIARVASAGRVGIVGYCYGGLLSWIAACRLDGLAAAVSYYGGGLHEQRHLQPRCPVLAHLSDRDAHVPLDGVEAFRVARPEVGIHLYAAPHGFNCDQRASHDAAAAALARERTLAFFARHLG